MYLKIKFPILKPIINGYVDKNKIDQNIEEFGLILEESCGKLFKKNHSIKDKNYSSDNKFKPWYDLSCKEKQCYFYEMLHIFRNNKSNENRKKLTKARTDYKNIIRNKKREYDKYQTKKLEENRFKNAKDYWKLLKGSCTPNKSKSLNATHFAKYFKSINNPESVFFQADEDVLNFNDRYLNGELQVMFEELNVNITYMEIKHAGN